MTKLDYVPSPSERLLGERYDDVFAAVELQLAECEKVAPLSRETLVLMVMDFALAEAERLGCIQGVSDAIPAGR